MSSSPKSNIFVLGNGESRDGIELKQFKQWGKIYGCNALYRDFKPDGLISTDWAMMHEIYSSGYCKENKCYFRQWKILPEQFYEMLQYTGLEQSSMEQLNEQLKKLDLDTVDKFLHQNEKGNRTSLVCHGIDPERFKDTILEVLSTFKGLPKGNIGKIDLATSPADTNRLYALIEAGEGQGGVYVSYDKGSSFKVMSNRKELVNRPF